MNIWKSTNWKKNKELCCSQVRSGLRLRFQKGIDNNVRRACIDFCIWLRKEFYFPIRVVIYFKSSYYIKAIDGTLVSATIFEPYKKNVEPYIKIATGDYQDLLYENGEDDALAAVIGSIIHELTHYFQWINGIHLSDTGYEIQASHYIKKILGEYAKTREHP